MGAGKSISQERLFDYLNCTCGTLHFACSADKAVVNFDWYGFSVFHFENINWASVYAGFVSVAFGVVNYYFYHFILPLIEFYRRQKRKIKAFRFINGFLHVFTIQLNI